MQSISQFQQKILRWYKKNKRDLPWRVPYGTHLQQGQQDPYKILISEVMSQQTQLSRVIPKYEAWIKTFPTLESLANASIRDVLHMWSGLGYNRRALYLKRCAEMLVKEPKGKIRWPKTEKELMKLPGVGKYTARAILCFAFNKQIAVIDTNVRKVILTQFLYPQIISSQKGFKIQDLRFRNGEMKKSHKSFSESVADYEMDLIAQALLPIGKAYEWNQALMDYAQVMLKKEKIPIAKQSHFLTSDRYYRGQIIKLLLAEKTLTFDSFYEKFGIEKKRLEQIIRNLEKEKLIVRRKNIHFMLP